MKIEKYIQFGLFLSVMCNSAFGQEGPSEKVENRVLHSAQMAVERAIEYSGFDESGGFDNEISVSAGLTVMENDNTPFLADKYEGRQIWKVIFNDIPVGQGTRLLRNRNFEIILDPETGKLIKIFSVSHEAGTMDTLPQPGARAAEMWFNDRKYDFAGLPDTMCKIPFWQALQMVIIANPADAKIIKAYYWNISGVRGPWYNSWIIILRGTSGPWITHGHDQSPAWINNFMMSIIDARTGISKYGNIRGPYDKEDVKKRRQGRDPLLTEWDAIAQAECYAHFGLLNDDQYDRTKISARLKTLDKVKIPFLWGKYAKKPIWIVTVRDLKLCDSHSVHDRKENSLRTFDFYIDPQTGHLLRIHSKLVGNSDDYNQEPPLDIIEKQLEPNEIYIGIPDKCAGVDFFEALYTTGTTFCSSREIIAHYLTIVTNGRRDTLDVWSIDYRGFPKDKFPIPWKLLHELDRDHRRYIIDAGTGKLKMESSAPTSIDTTE